MRCSLTGRPHSSVPEVEVNRHADETSVVHVTRIRPARNADEDKRELPGIFEPCAPRALLDV